MQNFSPSQRQKVIEQLSHKEYDLVVIGGGITGAGILLDAQSRGLDTILFEMQDFAAGTSSRSTKLIHGGLRYLKQMEFKLVAEVGKERKIVYHNGRHITRPEIMLLPITRNGSISKFGAWIGLWLYDFLAKVEVHERRKILTKKELIEIEPLLDRETVQAGAKYYEYRTDDARLTIEIIKAALGYGANALNYFKVVGFLYNSQNQISGVKVEDTFDNKIFEVKAKTIVNASGPWVDGIDNLDNKKLKNKIIHTKGVHLVVDGSKLPIKKALYFDVKDGRMIFAIPRDGKVYIGTTDTPYQGNTEHPQITLEDRNYLLEAINGLFENPRLSMEDIESGWAGLRPLVKQKNNSNPSAISRKDEIFKYPSGLITIAGGKLTGYRKMAERTVDMVSQKFINSSKILKPCSTHNIKLSGGDFENDLEFEEFIKVKTNLALELGVSPKVASRLVYRYGKNINVILGIFHRLSTEELEKFNMPPILLAELKYAIEFESIVTTSDFFIRRTSALYFQIDWVNRWKKEVNDYLTLQFNWTPEVSSKHFSDLEIQIEEVKGY